MLIRFYSNLVISHNLGFWICGIATLDRFIKDRIPFDIKTVDYRHYKGKRQKQHRLRIKKHAHKKIHDKKQQQYAVLPDGKTDYKIYGHRSEQITDREHSWNNFQLK
jgi:hypothetical protein